MCSFPSDLSVRERPLRLHAELSLYPFDEVLDLFVELISAGVRVGHVPSSGFIYELGNSFVTVLGRCYHIEMDCSKWPSIPLPRRARDLLIGLPLTGTSRSQISYSRPSCLSSLLPNAVRPHLPGARAVDAIVR
jgi:hypothetical protein